MAILIRSKWVKTSTIFRASNTSGKLRPIRTSKKLKTSEVPTKTTPPPPTTFFTLPAEIRQKILLGMFETNKLHALLHSPTWEADFWPAFRKHTKKRNRIISHLYELSEDSIWSFWRMLFMLVRYGLRRWIGFLMSGGG